MRILIKEVSKIVSVIFGLLVAIMYFGDEYLKTYLNKLPMDKSIMISNILAHYNLWTVSFAVIVAVAIFVVYFI